MEMEIIRCLPLDEVGYVGGENITLFFCLYYFFCIAGKKDQKKDNSELSVYQFIYS